MNILREILKDRMINGFIVALIIGISTINFVNNAIGTALDHIYKIATAPWSWKVFWGQVTLYLISIIVAMFIKSRSQNTHI